jgi:hypothetical protein
MNEAYKAGHDPVSPKHLALTYDRVISAHWRGETDAVIAFGTWFESHWSSQAPPEPDEPPEGTSILAGAGSGIRWYARGGYIFGYASSGSQGCYRIATTESVPALTAPWDLAPRPQTRTDILLHEAPIHASGLLPASSGRPVAAHISPIQGEATGGLGIDPESAHQNGGEEDHGSTAP